MLRRFKLVSLVRNCKKTLNAARNDAFCLKTAPHGRINQQLRFTTKSQAAVRVVCYHSTAKSSKSSLANVSAQETLPDDVESFLQDDFTKPDEVKGTSENPEDTLQPTQDGMEVMKYFPEHFYKTNVSSVYDMRSGSYQDISNADINKYFPEGFAGEVAQEFEFAGHQRWMIRDSTKLIYRFIEETEKRLKFKPRTSVPVTNTEAQGMHTKINIPRLTDRKEWQTAHLQVTRFGRDVIPITTTSSSNNYTSNALETTKGPGSLLESTIAQLHSQPLPDRIMLTGQRGVGKSFLLNQAVLYARQRGWLVLFVPQGWEQVMSGPFVEPITVTNLDGTTAKVFDNCYQTKVVLRGFALAHTEMLKSIKIKNTAALDKYEPLMADMKEKWHQALSVAGRDRMSYVALRAIVKEGDHWTEPDSLDEPLLRNYDFLKATVKKNIKSLYDLTLLGIAVDDLASHVFHDLVLELRTHVDHPVLIAVDQYNSWSARSAFAFNKRELSGFDLVVPHSLSFLSHKKAETQQWTIANGLCIAATSLKHNEGQNMQFDNVKASLPLRMRVPAYNQLEYLSAMSMYLQPGHSPIDAVLSWEDLLEFRMQTGSIGRNLREESVSFFLPKALTVYEHDFLMAALLGMAGYRAGAGTDDDELLLGRDEESDDFDPDLGYDADEQEAMERELDELLAAEEEAKAKKAGGKKGKKSSRGKQAGKKGIVEDDLLEDDLAEQEIAFSEYEDIDIDDDKLDGDSDDYDDDKPRSRRL